MAQLWTQKSGLSESGSDKGGTGRVWEYASKSRAARRDARRYKRWGAEHREKVIQGGRGVFVNLAKRGFWPRAVAYVVMIGEIWVGARRDRVLTPG